MQLTNVLLVFDTDGKVGPPDSSFQRNVQVCCQSFEALLFDVVMRSIVPGRRGKDKVPGHD